MDMKMKWYGDEAKAKARAGAAAGLKQWADDLLAASQAEVPVAEKDGGFLRDSGTATVDEANLVAAVSYSGPPDKPNLPIWVHEVMNNQHPIGKAKFLEGPLNASQQSGMATVAREIRAALATGGHVHVPFYDSSSNTLFGGLPSDFEVGLEGFTTGVADLLDKIIGVLRL